jgi:hypothetical protein
MAKTVAYLNLNTTDVEDRYYFDFVACTTAKGFAQVDTGQDASYFGTWANPFTLKTVCYAEGDLTLVKLDTPEEFVAELRECKRWNDEHGHRFLGIDPGFDEELRQRFNDLGMQDLYHESDPDYRRGFINQEGN